MKGLSVSDLEKKQNITKESINNLFAPEQNPDKSVVDFIQSRILVRVFSINSYLSLRDLQITSCSEPTYARSVSAKSTECAIA